jgi:hypothetical protein
MFQTTVGFETIVSLLEQKVCQLYAVMKNMKYAKIINAVHQPKDLNRN